MNDYNTVGLIGRLTRNAELQYTNSGSAFSKFSIAVNKTFKSEDGPKDEVSYFECILWGKVAESINKYLVKGKQVLISGRLKHERWKQDGQNRSKIVIVAEKIQMFGKGESNQNNKPVDNQEETVAFEDKIPF